MNTNKIKLESLIIHRLKAVKTFNLMNHNLITLKLKMNKIMKALLLEKNKKEK
jgi:hypothetical protein